MRLKMQAARRLLVLRLFMLGISWSFMARVCQGGFVGVVVGTQYTGAPTAAAVVALLQRQSVSHVRLLGGAGDGALLAAMAGTGMEVMVTLPNAELLGVGESNATARNWARANVQAYLPATNITSVCVGTDVLTSDPNAALVLLPALRFLRAALLSSNLSAHVRLSTTLHPSLILDSFPPSQAFFNKSWTPTVLSPLLDFLASSSSFLLLDLLSYDIYRAAAGAVSLDYALLNPLTPAQLVVDPNTLFQYRSLLDAVLDSAFFALARLNRSDLPLVVSAAGWPSAGGPDASPDNAALHNSNLIARVLNGSGTPKRPRSPLAAFLFELFDEDALSSASPTLRSYGLFNASSPSLAPVYTLRLSGSGPLLANDTSARLFCVAKPGADPDALQIALDWACAGAGGRANCSAIQPGQLCYLPDTLPAHASFAFNSYYQASGRADGSCDFGGVATVSTTDPGNNVCTYAGSAGNTTTASASNGTSSDNSTVAAAAAAASGPAAALNGTSGIAAPPVRSHLGFTLAAAAFLAVAISARF